MVEVVGNNISKWGEGPVWHAGILYYVDIEGHRVCSFNPATGDEQSWNVGERVGLVVPREEKGFVIAGDNGFAYLDPDSGKTTPIADPEPDKKPDNRFNDGKCDPSGRLWAGTISTVKKAGDASLYCLDSEGTVTTKYTGVTNSNGLCWTKDGTAMYYIDTPTKKIRRFDFNAASGEITNETIAIDTEAYEGAPDGMTIDENDNLWVAFCRGSVVLCFDAQTAEVLHTIELPVTGVTSCAFGGDDLSTLYITTGIFANLKEEGAGLTYSCRPGVKGLPSVPFAG